MEHLFSFQLLKLSLGVVKFLYGKNYRKSFSYFTFIVAILPWYQMWTKMGTKLYINDQECREEKILRSFLFSHHVLFSTSPFALSRDFKHFQISFILPVLPFYIFFQHHYFISLHFKSASYARLLKFLRKEIKYLFFFLWNVVYNHKKRLIFPIKI